MISRGQLECIGVDGRVFASSNQSELVAQLSSGEHVHRELRPNIGSDYVAAILQLLDEGAWLTQLIDHGDVRAVAVWRVFRTTYCGRRFEIDDLVTTAGSRSHGYGAAMLRWLEARATGLDCPTVTLNSALRRHDAHRFYAREGYAQIAFHFSKAVTGPLSSSRVS